MFKDRDGMKGVFDVEDTLMIRLMIIYDNYNLFSIDFCLVFPVSHWFRYVFCLSSVQFHVVRSMQSRWEHKIADVCCPLAVSVLLGQVKANAKALADTLMGKGHKLASDGTYLRESQPWPFWRQTSVMIFMEIFMEM